MKKLIILFIILFALTACKTEYRLCYDGVDRWKVQFKDWVFPWQDRFEIQGFCGEKHTIYYYDKGDALFELHCLRNAERDRREINNRNWRCE